MFWEEKFTGEEKFTIGEFSALNMKNCGRHNIRKHTEIKGIDKYVTLYILLKFDSLDNMRITSSESKVRLGILGKGLITSMGLKAKIIPKKYKKAMYDIVNVSKKYLSKVIREFEKLHFSLLSVEQYVIGLKLMLHPKVLILDHLLVKN